MVVWRNKFCWRIAVAAGLGCVPANLPAATSATSSSFSDGKEDAPALVDLGRVTPIENSSPGTTDDASPRSGNPLWSIPLSELSATRERPIFFASRRPLSRAVASAPVEPISTPQAATETDVERPPLALVGTVVGDSDAIAVFLHQPSQGILRLRSGDSNAGWSVGSIVKGEVVLTRAGRAETFVLPPPNPAGSTKTR